MFGMKRRRSSRDVVAGLHGRIVDRSREPELYLACGVPDSTEGRFESLTLHLLLVLRRLKQLPAPADEIAQELVDAAFAHLEIALREMGVGDFGVPKRMKKLGQAFYDRTSHYDRLLDEAAPLPLAAEIAGRVDVDAGSTLLPFAAYLLASERILADCDLAAILAGPPFVDPVAGSRVPETAEITR